ncbi:GNAT family N-acetyltransferase [Kineosporia sp. J2-2]|uniref:GNAT family N-acetyltransferase n=1 Tax=Kineosporia corallincola TaxID=2835133 RepID=A0ABS5TKQ9_9ACTN|nr:GNAT family N-acetyltransferase [Kineosporia corallincola]MBT0771690.1 GNAT family N-acetyltransferase [Kineosporia corallincola]
MTIRPPRPDELPALQEIEWAGGEAFREIGMPEIADDEPFPLETLEAYRAAGHAWVHDGTGHPHHADSPGHPDHPDRAEGVPVAYLLMDVVDGLFHVEQVSVHPRAAGRGLGRALIDRVAELAAAQGVPALTLTTFADVPWNAPYYARRGFRVMTGPGPQLRGVRRRERDHGLDRWPRVCMTRPVQSAQVQSAQA